MIANLCLLGANSEIGRVIARDAVRRGINVLAVSRTPRRQKNAGPNRAVVTGIDLLSEPSLTRLQDAVAQHFNGPFSIVHSVGDFWLHKPLHRTDISEVRSMYESHYLTLANAIRVLLPRMIAVGGGQITAFSCNSVLYNYPDMAPFTAAKAAVEAFVRCLANEQSENGITANAIALPTIRTRRVVKEKPRGDHQNYVTPAQVSRFVVDHVLNLPNTVTGTTIKMLKFSRTFYYSSFFDRNPRPIDA